MSMIHCRLSAKEVDVKITFVYAELEENVHMEHPPFMKDVGKDYYIILDKSIYDLVQEARQYKKKALEIFRRHPQSPTCIIFDNISFTM